MLSPTQKRRLQALRQQDENCLADGEREELNKLIQLVAEEQDASLAASTERLREERMRLEQENDGLRALLARQQRLAKRLERVIALSKAEKKAIASDVERLLAVSISGREKSR